DLRALRPDDRHLRRVHRPGLGVRPALLRELAPDTDQLLLGCLASRRLLDRLRLLRGILAAYPGSVRRERLPEGVAEPGGSATGLIPFRPPGAGLHDPYGPLDVAPTVGDEAVGDRLIGRADVAAEVRVVARPGPHALL